MFNTKSLIKVIACIFLAGAGLTSCGGDDSSTTWEGEDSSTTDDVEGETDSTTTVDNPVYDYAVTIGTTVEREDWTKERVQDFLTDNGYVNVTFQTVVVSEDSVDTDVADWKEGPDVYPYSGDRIVSLIGQGALSKLSETDAEEIKTDCSESALRGATFDSLSYGYPYAVTGGYFLYYNKTLVDETKIESMDTLLATLKEHGVKLLFQAGEPWYTMGVLSAFGAGYEVSLSENKNAIASIDADYDSENGVLGAKALKTIVTSSDIRTGTEDSLPAIAPTVSNGYGAVISGAWNYDSFVSSVGEENLGAAKLPTVTVEGSTSNLSSYSSYSYYGVNPKASGEDETRLAFCHEIAKYLANGESQVSLFEEDGTVPCNAYAAETSSVKEDVTAYALATQSLYSIPQSVVPDNVWTAPNDLYISLKEGSVSTDAQIREAMVAFNDEIEKI